MVAATALIGGSLAGLNQQIVGGGGFERFEDDTADTAIVLPDSRRTGGVQAPEVLGRRSAERSAATPAEPSPVLGRRVPADLPASAGAPPPTSPATARRPPSRLQ